MTGIARMESSGSVSSDDDLAEFCGLSADAMIGAEEEYDHVSLRKRVSFI